MLMFLNDWDRPTSCSYLSCGPRLVLWTAVHCNCLMHVLVHLKQMKRDSCYNSEAHRWDVKSLRCFELKQFISIVKQWCNSTHRHTHTALTGRPMENTQRSGPELLQASTCTTQNNYSKNVSLHLSHTCSQSNHNLLILVGETMQTTNILQHKIHLKC